MKNEKREITRGLELKNEEMIRIIREVDIYTYLSSKQRWKKT